MRQQSRELPRQQRRRKPASLRPTLRLHSKAVRMGLHRLVPSLRKEHGIRRGPGSSECSSFSSQYDAFFIQWCPIRIYSDPKDRSAVTALILLAVVGTIVDKLLRFCRALISVPGSLSQAYRAASVSASRAGSQSLMEPRVRTAHRVASYRNAITGDCALALNCKRFADERWPHRSLLS